MDQLRFLDQVQHEGPADGVSLAVRIRGALDAHVLATVLRELASRHAVDDLAEPVLQVHDLAAPPGDAREAELRHHVEALSKETAAARMSSLRAALLRHDDEDHVLLLAVHGTAAGPGSYDALLDGLRTHYEATAGAVDMLCSSLEETLTAIWCEVLGVEEVGPDDNFFLLGGHSLLATRMMLTIEELLGPKVSVRTLFENATVGRLAPRVGEAMTEADRARLLSVFEATAQA
ncbi:phosphopantetheine-binding protein [Streptomyces sp. NPDC005900]|uniref:phosphopantetheine-binding protein n=1 Tax=Streptomyces sp. NPDC005900 TaxID=3154569 RepID=UPI0033C8CDFA